MSIATRASYESRRSSGEKRNRWPARNILFPYARENIDSLIIKGSFPPLMLAPVNFDALYEQAKLAREREAASVQ